MDETAIRALLGIDEEADIGDSIRSLQTTVVAQKAVIETDKPTAEKAEVAQLRNDLAAVRSKLIIEETENARKILAIEKAAHKDRVEARVEKAISAGMPRVSRDGVIEYGMASTAEQLEVLINSIPKIDLTERGVATGHELAALEPTAAEAKLQKDMGQPTDEKWRLGVMRDKAKGQNLTIPEGAV